MNMNLRCVALVAILGVALPSANVSGQSLSLAAAIEQTAGKMATDLPRGTRVAVLGFESESDNLSYYIMEELTGALIGKGLEVADRSNLPYVLGMLQLKESALSDEKTAASVLYYSNDTMLS